MFVVGVKQVDGIILPTLFEDKIRITRNCPLTEKEIKYFNDSLQYVSKQLISEGRDNKDKLEGYSVVITFVERDGFGFKIEEGWVVFGAHFQIIMYNMVKVREAMVFDPRLVYVIFVEELVHHFWNIEDERKVKYKVVEILQQYNPDINLNLLRSWNIRV